MKNGGHKKAIWENCREEEETVEAVCGQKD